MCNNAAVADEVSNKRLYAPTCKTYEIQLQNSNIFRQELKQSIYSSMSIKNESAAISLSHLIVK